MLWIIIGIHNHVNIGKGEKLIFFLRKTTVFRFLCILAEYQLVRQVICQCAVRHYIYLSNILLILRLFCCNFDAATNKIV